MFFLPNTTSYAWSVLMPVWEWQVDELPPEPLVDAVQTWFDEAPAVGDLGVQPSGQDSDPNTAADALPPGSSVLEALALALASLPWQAPQEAQEAQADAAAGPSGEGPAPEVPLPAADALPPAPLPVPAPKPAPAPSAPAPAPAATKLARPAPAPAVPVTPTGRWVLAGWRGMPSYSLLRNVAAERVTEQPNAEDQEHTLAAERQRRHPGCGQP